MYSENLYSAIYELDDRASQAEKLSLKCNIKRTQSIIIINKININIWLILLSYMMHK